MSSSLDLLKQLTAAFKHCGWVNGLTKKQYDALNKANDYITKLDGYEDFKKSQKIEAEALREQGYSLRKIALVIGYNHPQSVKNLLNSEP